MVDAMRASLRHVKIDEAQAVHGLAPLSPDSGSSLPRNIARATIHAPPERS